MGTTFIALAGPPCSGKSATGAILAAMIRGAFLETDGEVEKSLGKTIPEIFSTLGETVFRSAEAETIRRILNGGSYPRAVLALGGGTLLHRETRELVETRCRLFSLTAPVDTLVARNQGGRPLAATEKQFRRLLELRAEHYASLKHPVNTEGRTPKETAMEIAGMLRKEDPARWFP